MLIRTSLIHANLRNISIDNRDEKLFENSVLEYSHGLLCLENVILGDLIFLFSAKIQISGKKISNIRAHFMVILGHQPYIWLYKQENLLRKRKIKPNAFFPNIFAFLHINSIKILSQCP